jgi:bifunctional non-homologous end joining protein LigD
MLYAFDLIEHDGDDLRNLPFLDRKAALARLLRNTGAGILFNDHIAEDGAVVFAHACRLGVEGIVSKKIDSTYQFRPVPRLDQGPQSRQYRRAAGAERELE